jgi:hypothetical protein
MFIDYDDFMADKHGNLINTMKFANQNITSSALSTILSADDKTRLNKGVSGRGAKAFSHEKIAYNMLVNLLSCYPTVDFSPIFSPLTFE